MSAITYELLHTCKQSGAIPTCNVTFAISTCFFCISSSNSGVKCSPAVGAAADPSNFAYTVW